MIFLDTSILVEATQGFRTEHSHLRELVQSATGADFCTAAHALTELYSVLTRTPKPHMLTPSNAVQVVEECSRRMSVIGLTAEETLSVIQTTAAENVAGGAIYDALLIACARKAKATAIYTLNIRHFERLAPDLVSVIRVP